MHLPAETTGTWTVRGSLFCNLTNYWGSLVDNVLDLRFVVMSPSPINGLRKFYSIISEHSVKNKSAQELVGKRRGQIHLSCGAIRRRWVCLHLPVCNG